MIKVQFTRITIVCLVAATALSGCAGSEAFWYKPTGYTLQEFNEESNKCKKNAEQNNHFDESLSSAMDDKGLSGAVAGGNSWGECMTQHGWVLQSEAKLSQEHKQYMATLNESWKELEAVRKVCKAKRISGELANYQESVECSNSQMLIIFQKNKFPRIDLIERYAQKRLEIAKKLDTERINKIQANKIDLDEYLKIIKSGIPE